MSKYSQLFLVIILNTLILFSCGKKNDPDPIVKNSPLFNNTPEAIAVNDDKSGGIYKGVLMGSTGTIKLVLQNGSVSAIITFDGVTKTLTTTSLASWTTGEAISEALFTADDWQLTFSVNADGSNPQIAVSIPGHTIQVALVKETSEELVRTFEGTYTRTDITFPLNCVIIGNEVHFPGLTSIGSISGSNISLDAPEKEFTLTGTVNDNKITGTGNSVETSETGTSDLPGTWNAHRTL